MDIKVEIWKDAKGYEGLYQVSNLGKVKSLRRNVIMKPSCDKDGYYQLILSNGKTRKRFFIHRLVYETFMGEIPEGMVINHKNERKDDNCIFNLNALTVKENVNWGTRTIRQAHSRGYAVAQINKETGEIIDEFFSANEASKQTNIPQPSISACCRGELKTTGGFIWKRILK